MHRLITPLLVSMLGGCASMPADLPPLPRATAVDVARYAGTWYPIANIPPGPEKDAYDSVEQYTLERHGKTIPTTFTYRKGGHDGELRTLTSTAHVGDDPAQAEWGVRFFWFQPVKAQYVIAWLAPDYSEVIVARDKRDYVWYMAREPKVSAARLQAARRRIAQMGYDVAKLQIVPRQ